MDYQGIQSCLLPTLSCLSVSIGPGGCLRHRCSSTSLRISLLHVEFHLPLPYSSLPVTYAVPRLSPGISLPSCQTAYAPFTPSHSDERSHPTYYRGCWHVVSRCFFFRYRHPLRLFTGALSSRTKVLYKPKAFFTHAAFLDHGSPHCPKFHTAASRRSVGRVSVPVCRSSLSVPLRITALLGPYPTNYHNPTSAAPLARGPMVTHPVPRLPLLSICGINPAFAGLSHSTEYVQMFYTPVRYLFFSVSTCAAVLFFFFQAEDGIRDDLVTGVQTVLFRSCSFPGRFSLLQTSFPVKLICSQPNGDRYTRRYASIDWLCSLSAWIARSR